MRPVTEEDKKILFLDAPANSPDLYIIDRLYKVQKRLLQDARFKTTSSSAIAVNSTQSEITRVWQRNPEFDRAGKQKACISFYKELALKSKNATPAWSNRYRGS